MSGVSGQLPSAASPVGPQIVTQLINIAQNLGRLAQQGTTPIDVSVTLVPIAAPAAPAAGFTLYVDATTGNLMGVSSLGNRRILALP